MTRNTTGEPCVKCTNNPSITKCYGCQQSFCSEHLIKHRSNLAEQMDDLTRKYDDLQQDLERNKFEDVLISSIYSWERKSMRKIQEVAEKVRCDVQEWANRTKVEVRNSLDQMAKQMRSSGKTDNFTELDLKKWMKQLQELRKSLEKTTTISVVENEAPSTSIPTIKLAGKPADGHSFEETSNDVAISPKSMHTAPEHFVKMYGSCELNEEDRVVTHRSYRAGLSQVCGYNQYSSGVHAIRFLIEKKGEKNLFIGIFSTSHQIISPTFDYSVHGWWNFNHRIINGESKGDGECETVQSSDQLTLRLDCDQQRIQLEHQRSKTSVRLPIDLEVCPFPWTILVRLLSSGDSIRILS